nr:unnamed protein product [Ipomoea batatas]
MDALEEVAGGPNHNRPVASNGGGGGNLGPGAGGGDNRWLRLLQQPLHRLSVGLVTQFQSKLKDPGGTESRHANSPTSSIDLFVSILVRTPLRSNLKLLVTDCSFRSGIMSTVKYFTLKAFNWSLFSFCNPQFHSSVAFSKIHLHSFKISDNALAVLFVISICPFGRPRTVATSSAVIWIFGVAHGLVALQPWLVFLEVPLSEGHHHLPWWCHPLHPFAPGCQPRLLGQVVLLQSTLSGAAVLVQWVAALVALVLAL